MFTSHRSPGVIDTLESWEEQGSTTTYNFANKILFTVTLMYWFLLNLLHLKILQTRA